MHMYLWDAKGSELYMQCLVQQFRNKGIPLAAKPLGLQRVDGWTRGYQSLSLPQQLLQTDPTLLRRERPGLHAWVPSSFPT